MKKLLTFLFLIISISFFIEGTPPLSIPALQKKLKKLANEKEKFTQALNEDNAFIRHTNNIQNDPELVAAGYKRWMQHYPKATLSQYKDFMALQVQATQKDINVQKGEIERLNEQINNIEEDLAKLQDEQPRKDLKRKRETE